MVYYSLLGPFVRMLPAETAHNAAICALKSGLLPPIILSQHDSLKTRVFGLDFPNPIGLAAGFDKEGQAIDGLLAQGFGFIEVGTVTPLPQPGNPKPRLFRLTEDRAVINRFGFNSSGIDVFAANLKKRSRGGIVGANISRNKASLDAADDYSKGLAAVYELADYVTVNISSPNTVGLRDLQQKQALSSLMKAIEEQRAKMMATGSKRKPLLYKIAPDLMLQDKEDIIEVALAYNIDGLIVSNTTVSRPESLRSSHKQEQGGLSGKPLFTLATEALRDVYRLSKGKIPLIGSGGIASAEDAYTKIKAGASLVQLYTALVYQGFELVRDINEGLPKLLARDGFKNISEAVGKDSR